MKDADIKERSPEDQQKIIQAYVKKIDIFDDSIDIENIVTVVGGGEGSRTPVQKHSHKVFSERSPSFKFSSSNAAEQAFDKVALLNLPLEPLSVSQMAARMFGAFSLPTGRGGQDV